MPRSNPGNRKEYKRVNGPFTLYMVAGGGNKLPYGNLPRLILAWVSTEAVRTQSRELVLGKSLSEFMRTLGIYNSGGNPQTRLRNQMRRLFHCTVSLIYEDERGAASASSLVADRTEFWWNERKPDEPSLWESKIRLGEDFFNEIINHPVPLDMNTLTALKRCSLGLDLYLWLVYRQFGLHPDKASDKKTVQNFRIKVLRELKKIKIAWPELNYASTRRVDSGRGSLGRSGRPRPGAPRNPTPGAAPLHPLRSSETSWSGLAKRTPISVSWRGCWRCAHCPAPIPATGKSMSVATARTRW